MRKVTIVVLSFERPELLRKALHSIAVQSEPQCEVIVVDNASPRSEIVRGVVSEFPGVRLIANASNLGFTGGMNCGIAAAAGSYIYLTEDDIELDRNCIAALVAYLRAARRGGPGGPGDVELRRGHGAQRGGMVPPRHRL